MSRLRVGFWVPTFSRAGGTETWHRTLLKGLDREQIEVMGIQIEDGDFDDEIADELIGLGCGMVVFPTGTITVDDYDWFASCDVVVLWGDLKHAAVKWANSEVTVVMVAHGDGSSLKFTRANHDASPWVDHYVAVSEAALEAIPEDRRQDATVIKNGIDFNALEPKLSRDEQRDAWGVPRSARVLGMVARASEEKDPKALARAIRSLPGYWYGVLIGDGHELLNCVSDSFTSNTRCFYPGATSDVGSAYQAIDCLLSPSLSEGFGYSALEAMAFGRPVVATAVGILANVKESPSCPVEIVPVSSPGNVLAEAVERAMSRLETEKGRRDLLNLQLMIQTNYKAESFCRNWTNYLLRLPCKTRAQSLISP